MPVEFIGMIGTKDQSEIRHTGGPVIDRDYVRRFARAHEDAGFDRVLIGYALRSPTAPRSPPTPPRTPSGSASWSPTVPASSPRPSPPARSPPWTSSPRAGSRCTSSPAAATPSSARDGDYLAKDERYARTDEYLDILKLAWTSDAAVQLRGHVLPGRGLRRRRQARPSSRGSGCTSAAPRTPPTGSAASTPTPSPCGASPWPRPSEQIASVNAAAQDAGRSRAPGISVSFRPILGPTEELAWERAHRILETTKENLEQFRAQWRHRVLGTRRRRAGERRLAAAAGRRRQGRAARPRAVDPAGGCHRRGRQLHRPGRHARRRWPRRCSTTSTSA